MTSNGIVRAKCIVYGESTVGKTSLVQSFMSNGNQFSKNYQMTAGVEVHTKTVKVPDTSSSVELFLYDCSGKDFYKDIVLMVCKSQPSMVLMMYDVTSEQSFKNIADKYEQIVSGGRPVRGVLYGCKTDLTNRRLISPKAGRSVAENLGLTYFEGSPKEGKGVDEPFFFLVNEWFKTYTDKTTSIRTLQYKNNE